jgi:hypothetical protein
MDTAKIQQTITEIDETQIQLTTLNNLNRERIGNYIAMMENIMDEHFTLCHAMFAVSVATQGDKGATQQTNANP